MKSIFSLAFVLFTFISCNKKQDKLTETESKAEVSMMKLNVPEREENPSNLEADLIIPKDENSKIIKTANIKFRVENLNKSLNNVSEQVKSIKGYIVKSNRSREDKNIMTELLIKVPQESFDNINKKIVEGSIFTDYHNIEAEDISENYYDLASRAKSQKALENRYLELLKKAKNVKEILEIEEQLGKIREEIEAKEGRLKYYDNQVAFSTLNLIIYEEIESEVNPDISFIKKIWNNIKAGFNVISDFILLFFNLLPLLLVFIGLWFLIRKVWKKYKG